MTEIEIKAHVYDRNRVVKKLNEFAIYEDSVIRDDVYYKTENSSKPGIRLRKETRDRGIEYLITYKRKENRIGEDGLCIEVNNELETSIADPTVLAAFLIDSGYKAYLTKHKEVKDWIYQIDETTKATLELCAVPPLGDFLEIEVLSEKNDEDTVSSVRDKLKFLLSKAEIPERDIEDRYYSEMLNSK